MVGMGPMFYAYGRIGHLSRILFEAHHPAVVVGENGYVHEKLCKFDEVQVEFAFVNRWLTFCEIIPGDQVFPLSSTENIFSYPGR